MRIPKELVLQCNKNPLRGQTTPVEIRQSMKSDVSRETRHFDRDDRFINGPTLRV